MTLDARISLHKLSVFSLVVELGSVSRAAERLIVTQPVVSAHLRSLEQALGCALFETRGGHRVLTESGIAVHRWAQETLRATRELERRTAGGGDGQPTRIVLAASMSLGSYRLARVLARVLVAHPWIELHEQIADIGRIVESTTAGSIDFGLVLGGPQVERPDLRADLIGHEPLVLLTAPGAVKPPPATSAVLPLEALSKIGLIQEHGGDGTDEAVRRALAGLGLGSPRVVMELGHPEAIKRVVARGVGAAFLPRSSAAAEIERGELEVLTVEGLKLEVPVYLLTHAGRTLSPLESELVDALRDDYAQAQPD